MIPNLEPRGQTLLLKVKVVPNSSRTQLAGMLGDALKIKVAAPPEDGKANRAVEKLIAQTLGLAPRDVTVVAGHSTAPKTLQLSNITRESAAERLTAALH